MRNECNCSTGQQPIICSSSSDCQPSPPSHGTDARCCRASWYHVQSTSPDPQSEPSTVHEDTGSRTVTTWPRTSWTLQLKLSCCRVAVAFAPSSFLHCSPGLVCLRTCRPPPTTDLFLGTVRRSCSCRPHLPHLPRLPTHPLLRPLLHLGLHGPLVRRNHRPSPYVEQAASARQASGPPTEPPTARCGSRGADCNGRESCLPSASAWTLHRHALSRSW